MSFTLLSSHFVSSTSSRSILSACKVSLEVNLSFSKHVFSNRRSRDENHYPINFSNLKHNKSPGFIQKFPKLRLNGILYAALDDDSDKFVEYSSGQEDAKLEEDANTQLSSSLQSLSESLSALSHSMLKVSSALEAVLAAVKSQTIQNADSVKSSQGESSASIAPTNDSLTKEVEASSKPTNSQPESLAFLLQRAFIQARVLGLGKSCESSMEEFVDLCMEAKAKGISLEEFQLQLILAEGSLPSDFALISIESSSNQYAMREARIRSSWIKLVYMTLFKVESLKASKQIVSVEKDKSKSEIFDLDLFVNQTVDLITQGDLTLNILYKEYQLSIEKEMPPSIKMMKESQLIIAIAYSKAIASN